MSLEPVLVSNHCPKSAENYNGNRDAPSLHSHQISASSLWSRWLPRHVQKATTCLQWGMARCCRVRCSVQRQRWRAHGSCLAHRGSFSPDESQRFQRSEFRVRIMCFRQRFVSASSPVRSAMLECIITVCKHPCFLFSPESLLSFFQEMLQEFGVAWSGRSEDSWLIAEEYWLAFLDRCLGLENALMSSLIKLSLGHHPTP